MSTFAQPVCAYCGAWHNGTCPRIKTIEYHSDGSVRSVEFHDSVVRDPQGWPLRTRSVSVAESLCEFRRRVFALAFKAWCKTPRWLALRSWYLPFYGRVGWALDDLAYGHLRDEYRRVREGHRG